MMKWSVQIQDPSGELRRIPIQQDVEIDFKDARVPAGSVTAWARFDREPRLELDSHDPRYRWSFGGVSFSSGVVPPATPVRMGDTQLSIEPLSSRGLLPTFPPQCRRWETVSRSGTELLWSLRKASESTLAIYIEGETGTGKELLAHLAHAWSERASGPFVAINCGALPLGLAESELFGHVKGAFTGAAGSRAGALMQAHGGTLFLDEIADLPLEIQVKLLRFLENGEIRPVGADRVSHAQVRLVCATHKPLRPLVESGQFRRDLYYRVASVTIRVPALRERPEDIEYLAREYARELGKTLTPRAIMRLKVTPWAGNVRELRHAIERAAGLAGSATITLDEDAFRTALHEQHPEPLPTSGKSAALLTLHEMERHMLLQALRLCEGHRTRAARQLGVARSTLFEMLKRHGIRGPRTFH